MSELEPAKPNSAEVVPARLHEIARLLREADHLGPEVRRELAELADDFAGNLRSSAMPTDEEIHLAATAGRLIEGLRHRDKEKPLLTAREQLVEALLEAEARAPLPTGLARRLLEVLANIGI
jgi:hypothetical protein